MLTAGEFVSLRGRRWLVEDGAQSTFNTLRLTCIDDDASGEPLTVVVDAEIGHQAQIADPWATVAASGASSAPAARYSSLVRPMAAPALFCTRTLCPRNVSSRTLAGVRPTRYSWFLISFGTPIFMVNPSLDDEKRRCRHGYSLREIVDKEQFY